MLLDFGVLGLFLYFPAKRLAGKTIFIMTRFLLSGTLNLNSVNQLVSLSSLKVKVKFSNTHY